jgi:hypothetical protein
MLDETNQGLLQHGAAEPDSAGMRGLYWLAVSGVVLNSLRSLYENRDEGTLFTDPYWVGFFIANYQDGFRRRALIGSICRQLFPGGINIWVINVWASLVLCVAFVLMVRALVRLSLEQNAPRGRLFLFALSASVLTSAFYETLGDMLQLSLVLFCLTAMLAARWLRQESVRRLPLLAVAVPCACIHESSIFLAIPALPFFLKARPRLRDVALPACLYVALLLLALHWTDAQLHPTYHANLLRHMVQLASASSATALRWEPVSEYHFYFSSFDAFLYFLGRFPRILVLGFAYLFALVVCLPRRLAERTLQAMVCIVLSSLPLWCIAIDWGRFLSYALFLALVSTALWWKELVPDGPPAPAPFVRLAARLEALSKVELIRWGVLFVLLVGPECQDSHIDGINLQDALGFCVVAAAALLARRRGAAGAPTAGGLAL